MAGTSPAMTLWGFFRTGHVHQDLVLALLDAAQDVDALDYATFRLHALKGDLKGFWSLIKRGMVGAFHKISKKYLSLYVAEFQFRYNNRLTADIFGPRSRSAELIISRLISPPYKKHHSPNA